MNRVTMAATEVGIALSLFPPVWRDRLGFDLFTADPVFAGIGHYGPTTKDGRSYHDTAHVNYPWHVHDQRTTVVIPTPIGVAHTVHELAHVLDEALSFAIPTEPVTKYAQTNRKESFAEFVTALLVPNYLASRRRIWRNHDTGYVLRDSPLDQHEALQLLGAA